VLMVLKGKANLSDEHALRLATLMKLNKKETKYLIEIVNYNQRRSVQDKKLHLKKMARINKTGTVLLNPDQYEYYQKWYYSVIHEILSFYPFKDDFKSLAKMVNPPISQREAMQAVTLLERLQFIKKNADGTYTCEYPGISAYAEGHSLVLSSYADTMISQGRAAIQQAPGDERSVSWAGFSMSKSTFEKIKEEAREFRKRIITMAQEDQFPDRAYHFNMQIFPVSQQHHQTSQEDLCND
ncbi:MAG TPA: TIGR02147 family protein, partial [Chitinispirillaceae bacterium]|nr:TIGR02147 family protein [Chitinispirillaceae bacterium]